MIGAVDGITRKNLSGRISRVLRPSKAWKPDVFLARGDSGKVVVKDYRSRGFFYRFIVGIPSVWNEARIYRKLQGIPGIPRYIGTLDRYAGVIEFVEGRTAAECNPADLPPDFISRVEGVVHEIHRRNIVVCDLRNKKNVLVSDKGDPYLIDLSTAFERGWRINFFRNAFFRIFYQDDLMGMIKLKRHLAPERVTPEENEKLNRGLFLEKEVVAVRDFFVRWLKKIFAGRDVR